jgi:biotin carboxyl carrier protein
MKEYKYKVNGVEYKVNINSVEGNVANVEVNGVSYKVELENKPAAPASAPAAAPKAAPAPAPAATAAPAAAPAPAPAAPKAAPATGAGKALKAPLPGVINDIKVAVGDQVKSGQTVIILEAMKMENEIQAECDGTVTSIAVNKGDSVMEDAVLLTIG